MRKSVRALVLASVTGSALVLASCEDLAAQPNAVFWGTYAGTITTTVHMPGVTSAKWTAATTLTVGSDEERKDESHYLLIPRSGQSMSYQRSIYKGLQDVTITISGRTIVVDAIDPPSASGVWTSRYVYEFSEDFQGITFSENGSCPVGSGVSSGTLTRTSAE